MDASHHGPQQIVICRIHIPFRIKRNARCREGGQVRRQSIPIFALATSTTNDTHSVTIDNFHLTLLLSFVFIVFFILEVVLVVQLVLILERQNL